MVYIIAWTWCSVVLSSKISISLALHLTTISRVSSSVTYTISRTPISLYYLLYLFFLLLYYILCFTSPAHPSPFILYVLRYIGTTSCVDPISCSLFLNIYYILDSYWSCVNCYISPLHPSAHNAAYSAHNPCRRREARYLAFYWIPVKSHRPKPSLAISSVFQYLVLYTIHQPRYIVVSNGAMNMCILHKYLRYNILWLIIHSYTIYCHATRSARSAVSRALCSYRYSLPAACKTCDTAQLSQARAMLCTAAIAVQRTAHDTAYSLNYVHIA